MRILIHDHHEGLNRHKKSGVYRNRLLQCIELKICIKVKTKAIGVENIVMDRITCLQISSFSTFS